LYIDANVDGVLLEMFLEKASAAQKVHKSFAWFATNLIQKLH
jgi:hypothetical protein